MANNNNSDTSTNIKTKKKKKINRFTMVTFSNCQKSAGLAMANATVFIILLSISQTIQANPTVATAADRFAAERSNSHRFDWQSHDGAMGVTRPPPPDSTTTVSDIRKLLEDYVNYLASLPDYSNHHHSNENNADINAGQDISTAESESDHSLIRPRFEPVAGHQIESPVDATVEPISLSLNDEELNSFIENVLVTMNQANGAAAAGNNTATTENGNVDEEESDHNDFDGDQRSDQSNPVNSSDEDNDDRHPESSSSSAAAAFIPENVTPDNGLVDDENGRRNDAEPAMATTTTAAEPLESSTTTTTVSPMEERLESSESNADDNRLNQESPTVADTADQKDHPPNGHETTNNDSENNSVSGHDLLEQLRRTKELLQQQIERLKSLEQNVLKRNNLATVANTVPMIDNNKNNNNGTKWLQEETDNHPVDSGDAIINNNNGDDDDNRSGEMSTATTTTEMPLLLLSSSSAPLPVSSPAPAPSLTTTTEPSYTIVPSTSSESSTSSFDGEIVPLNNNDVDDSTSTTTTTQAPITDSGLALESSTAAMTDDRQGIQFTPTTTTTMASTARRAAAQTEDEYEPEKPTTPGIEVNDDDDVVMSAVTPNSIESSSPNDTVINYNDNGAHIINDNYDNDGGNKYLTTTTAKTVRPDDDDDGEIIDSERGRRTFGATGSTGHHIILSPENSTMATNVATNGGVETMILTHVPKITIIHKIMKPLPDAVDGDANDSRENGTKDNDDRSDLDSNDDGEENNNKTSSQEALYQEALRKHQDLIRSTMSSMSLYPAAFKRYRLINPNSNKINSVGEIYLLPNFSPPPPPPSSNESRMANHQQAPNHLGQHHRRRHNHSDSVGQTNNKLLLLQLNRNHPQQQQQRHHKNKFNQDNSNDDNNSHMVTTIRPKKRTTTSSSNKKFLLNYHTVLSINRNPANIIKLYRPRYKLRKRFRKVRIPHHHGHHRNRKDHFKNPDVEMITSTAAAVTEPMTRPEDGITATTTVSPPTTTVAAATMATTIMAETVRSTATESPPSATTAIPMTMATTLKPEAEPSSEAKAEEEIVEVVSSTTSTTAAAANHSSPSTPLFKIFCTFDAHQSMVAAANGRGDGRFFDIDQLERNARVLNQCSHLVYAFANIDLNGEVSVGDGGGGSAILDTMQRAKNRDAQQANLIRLLRLKKNFPHLQILAAVGGWDTPPQLFSLMVATGKLRDRLSANIHKFLLEYGFDGAIIAWFYPVYGMKSTLDSRSARAVGQTLFQLDDQQNLVKFVRTLKERFQSIGHQNLELGIMVPPFEEFIDRGYDAAKLAQLVDHLILMTYDYYGSWENQVQHFAPLYPANNNNGSPPLDERNKKYNINYTLDYWINGKQAPRNKTSIGVAFYGRSFTLANESDGRTGAAAIGPGAPGPDTNRPGLLSFNELCELYLTNPNVKLSEDEFRITANLQLYDQWVGFDDELSLYLKTKFAMANQLSGMFIWSINYDDYRNRCGWGPFPLLKAVNKAVEHCSMIQCNGSMVMRPNWENATTTS